MEVICAGLSRTGTYSLNEALKILGYNAAYHWKEHVENHLPFWEGVYSGEIENPDFAKEYAGVQATTDLPAAYFFEEFYQAFPDAKVILTVRDNEDVWCKSYLQFIEDRTLHMSFIYWFFTPSYYRINIFYEMVVKAVYGSTSATILKRKYRQHNNRVMAAIPSDKLLVFNAKDGWKPLCQFLGKEIPTEPYPFANQTGVVRSSVAQRKRQIFLKAIVISGSIVVLSLTCWKLLK